MFCPILSLFMSSDFIQSLHEIIKQASIMEWLVFICALIYIIFIALENSIGWLFGFLSSFFSVYICYQVGLFLESGLNILYCIIGIYGWHQWLYGSYERKEIMVTQLSFKKNFLLFLIGIIFWLLFGFFAKSFSKQVLPYLDAFITAFSIIATWMTAKKYIENWIYWIFIDALSIILFASREYYLLAFLNFIYIIIAVFGFLKWRRVIIS